MKTKVYTDGFEGYMGRSLARIEQMQRGEPITPSKSITFDSPAMMMECLTEQRIRLCQVARKKRLSISALAVELGRNRGSVTRDIKRLQELGLIQLREEVNPGHGIVQIVEPVAKNFDLRCAV
jgi:predicted transcriptional regulator